MSSNPNGGAYFSNHSSQSRFVPNATSSNANSNTNTSSQPNPNPGPRLRASSSKHFSLSISNEERHKDGPVLGIAGSGGINPGSNSGQVSTKPHPLRTTWVFWFRQQRMPGKVTNYEEGIKKVAAFSSVESFWSLWTHLNPPSSLQATTDYLLFRNSVRRPVWEDPVNIQGGKWIIRLRKGIADRLWEDLVLAVIGDQFDELGTKGDGDENGVGDDEICGCTISVRGGEDILALWNKTGSDTKTTTRIKETIRRVLNLPPQTIMEYKSNNDSLQDKSSFRTTSSHNVHDRS